MVVVTAEPPSQVRSDLQGRQGGGLGVGWPQVASPAGGRAWLGVLPLRDGETLGLRFVHSVDGLPVEDAYGVQPQSPWRAVLVQVETRLLSFGTGMGAMEGQGRALEEGAWLRIAGMNRVIGAVLRVRVGSAAVDHRLVYRGCALPLSDRWAGWRVRLEARMVPAWLHGLLSARNGVWRWARRCPEALSG